MEEKKQDIITLEFSKRTLSQEGHLMHDVTLKSTGSTSDEAQQNMLFLWSISTDNHNDSEKDKESI